jgi:NTE family protein
MDMTTKPRDDGRQTGPRIGLALGGGGARGFAHIHVIEAVAEMGLRPTIMSGTSIGAVMATGYATGIDADEVRDYAERLVGSHRHAIKLLIARRPLGLLELFDFRRSGGAILKGEAILELALPELMQHSFSTLTIPTRVVATDFYGRHQTVFDEGALRPALAASIALPSLFSPVQIDGRYYVDGGMTNPLPYDIIENDADIIIASDVTGVRTFDRQKAPSTAEVLFGSIQITLHALVDAKLAMRPPQVLIQPPIEEFRVLDFFKLKQIIEATKPVKDEVKRKLETALTLYERQRTVS